MSIVAELNLNCLKKYSLAYLLSKKKKKGQNGGVFYSGKAVSRILPFSMVHQEI
jgi:hypothetical protein